MDSEQIVLEIDERPATQAAERANAAIEGHEKAVKTVMDSAGKQWEVYGEKVIRVSDKSKSSLDRLTKSMEAQAALAGKTGVDRLIAQRDILIAKWGKEERAVDAITKSYARLIEVEQAQGAAALESVAAAEASGPAWTKLGLGIKDVFEGRTAYGQVEGGKFIASLSGMALGAGIAAGAVLALGFAAEKSMSSLGGYAREMENLHLRTGLAIEETEKFAYAAKAAGADADVYERIMRGLSEAANENSRAGEKARGTLARLGVDLRDKLTGDLRSTSDVLMDLSVALNKLPEGMERDSAAIDILKRAGIETIPVLEGLAKGTRAYAALGGGMTNDDLKRWKGYQDLLNETSARWELLKRNIMAPLAAVWNVTLKIGGKVVDIATSSRELATMFPRDNKVALNQDLIDEEAERKNAQAIAARRSTDAYIKSAFGNKTLEDQLKEAEAALTAMGAPPKIGETPLGAKDGGLAEAKAYKAAEDKVKNLKAQIEAVHQLTEAEKKLKEFEKSMGERDLDPVARLYKQRDDLGLKPGSKGYEEATTFTNLAALRLLVTENKKLDDEIAKDRLKMNKEMAKSDAEAWDEQYKLLEKHDKDVLSDASKRLAAFREAKLREDKDAIAQLDLDAGHAGKMLEIATKREGPQGEIEALQVELGVKQAIRAQEIAIKEVHASMYDMDSERHRNETENLKDRYEMEEKILEVQKKEFDTVQRSVEKLVNTLLTKPANFGKELGQTLHAAIVKPIAEGVSHVAATMITPVIYGPDGQGGISGAMRGLFGGGKPQDPLKLATDMNTAVTTQNSMALSALTAILAGAMGVSPPAIAAPAGFGGISLPSISAPSVTGGFAPMLAPAFSQAFGGGGGGAGAGMSGGPVDLSSLPTTDRNSAALTSLLFGGGASGGARGGGGGLGGLLGMAGGAGQGGPMAAGLTGIIKNFRGNLGGFTRGAGSVEATNVNGVTTQVDVPGRITGVNGLAGAALTGGGMMLAQQGLLGSTRGTLGGVAEGTLGGAAVGLAMGGPLGAAIGAGVGFGIGISEMLAGIETPENKAKRLVKQIYGISISNGMAKQIASLAQSKYGGNVNIAVRDPDTRKMLQLYATGTGQKFPLSATTPEAGSLAEQGGKLYQQATYQYGNPYTFQSSLPVAGGFATGTYPSSSSAGPTSVTLSLNGQSAADLLEGRIANTVTPGFVQDAYANSQSASNGRLSNSAMIQQPGLIVS